MLTGNNYQLSVSLKRYFLDVRFWTITLTIQTVLDYQDYMKVIIYIYFCSSHREEEYFFLEKKYWKIQKNDFDHVQEIL